MGTEERPEFCHASSLAAWSLERDAPVDGFDGEHEVRDPSTASVSWGCLEGANEPPADAQWS